MLLRMLPRIDTYIERRFIHIRLSFGITLFPSFLIRFGADTHLQIPINRCWATINKVFLAATNK